MLGLYYRQINWVAKTDMKILMLGWELPPHYAGGMGTVCYSLSKQLAESGADIDFILPFEADYSDVTFMRVNPRYRKKSHRKPLTYRHLQEIQATVYGKVKFQDQYTASGMTITYDLIQNEYHQKIYDAVMSKEYDIIHAHDWLTLRGAMLAKQLSGLPLIVHVHATEFDRSGADESSGGNPLIHDIEYEGLMMADRIIAVSQWTKNIIVHRYGIPADKIDVVHNSIDLYSPYLIDNTSKDIYKYIRRMKENGYKLIFNAGRHSIQKGLRGFLDAARLAIDKNPKLLFLFIGGGDMHEELIMHAAELGISGNVIFTGFKNGSALRQAFINADLFVMPSVSEPFGTTVLEAIGFGTPVIVSKQSGVAEILSGAIKIDFWDIVQMADAIHAVTSEPALSSSMIEMGYRDFQNQSWERAALATSTSYKRALEATV